MSYQPQPGTIPFRAIAWLQKHHSDGAMVAGAVLCEELGIDMNGFSSCMAKARAGGLVKASVILGARKALEWGLGAERMLRIPGEEVDDHPARGASDIQPRPGPLFPGVSADGACCVKSTEFRAAVFEGKLLASGMEIIDGVAVFTAGQVLALKRHTDWWAAS